MRKIIAFVGVYIGFLLPVKPCQHIHPDILNNKWDAHWISAPGISLREFNVLHFRKRFQLDEADENFLIHVSADNRYRLYVNGEEIGKGPARGDFNNWFFDTYELSQYLRKGDNVIAAVVWNFAEYAPMAQITNKTGFIVQGNSKKEHVLNTGSSWTVFVNPAYIVPQGFASYTTVGPNEIVDGNKYPFSWQNIDFDDTTWLTPILLGQGTPKGKTSGWEWALLPRAIPQLEYEKESFFMIRSIGEKMVDQELTNGIDRIVVPPNKKVKILLDKGKLTTAYPVLKVSKGRGSVIDIAYAEALVNEDGAKGNRDDLEGKHMPTMLKDTYISDGGDSRVFQPLWFRTFRYVELSIETKDEPLIIDDIYCYFTAYPFRRKAVFESRNVLLDKIWDVGWHTARLCSGETYYDCPYYEQLQYIGDTRIQALISLNLTDDDRLVRAAIEHFKMSVLPDGLTQSRYPSSEFQVIPGFSLMWIAMVHDYMLYRDDMDFILEQSQTIENILRWFESHIQESGMLGKMDYWNFVDWAFGPWRAEIPIGGTPPATFRGNSSVLSLLYIYGIEKAIDIFEALGNKDRVSFYSNLSRRMKTNVYDLCWDSSKGLLADSPEKNSFSQHANALAVLVGMFPETRQQEVMLNIMKHDNNVLEASLYFKFYVFQALKTAGLADRYMDFLLPWEEMLDIGLTTFSETPEPTRSDCHAWSAHPIIDFMTTICGIEPTSPGYQKIKIQPHLGKLTAIKGIAIHPRGEIHVDLTRRGSSGIEGVVELPKGEKAVFVWGNNSIELDKEYNTVVFNNLINDKE